MKISLCFLSQTRCYTKSYLVIDGYHNSILFNSLTWTVRVFSSAETCFIISICLTKVQYPFQQITWDFSSTFTMNYISHIFPCLGKHIWRHIHLYNHHPSELQEYIVWCLCTCHYLATCSSFHPLLPRWGWDLYTVGCWGWWLVGFGTSLRLYCEVIFFYITLQLISQETNVLHYELFF